MKPRAPLTRYYFIDQMARAGTLARIDPDGTITRPLRPHGPTVQAGGPGYVRRRPEPMTLTDLKAIFTAGDATHRQPFKPWPVG